LDLLRVYKNDKLSGVVPKMILILIMANVAS